MLDEREAEAVTRLLAATMEALENPIRVAFREAGAAILHAQPAALQHAAHPSPSPCRNAFASKLRRTICKSAESACNTADSGI